VEPNIFQDKRGFFCETYSEKKYREAGIPANFVQDNISMSEYGVLRGLHYQIGTNKQAKLVGVIQGTIFDVALDLRKSSPTFGKWESCILEGPMKRQFYIPAGFAHGFCVLSETALISYKCDAFYSPFCERGIIWNDPALAINWPVKNPILSEKDRSYPAFADQKDFFE
jgi:dTDP-4-dehydrorhamnose 3,5-epimerase